MVCRVALIGLGDMGRRVAAAALNRKGLRIIGAVDSDPSKIGKTSASTRNLEND